MPRSLRITTVLLALAMALPAVAAEPLPFKRALELALKHSGTMAIALAEQTRTHQNYLEQRNGYIPSVTFGSGLGYSFGVPLTIEGAAPSIFSVSTQQYAFNLSQRAIVRATQTEWKASELDLLDKKNEVLLETALVYTELDNLNSKLKVLREAADAAQRSQFITSERLKEGIDSELDLKKARLAAARIQLRLAEAAGNADVLRERLAKLTGLNAASLQTVTESVPQAPDVPQDDETAAQAADYSPAVRLAFEKAKAADFRAQAEHKALLPSFDLASQYSMLSRYNNYDVFYKTFERNNFTAGMSFRFPIFNLAQRAAAQAADAEALKVKKQAEMARNQVQADTLKLQRSLRQLAAARDVAKLEYEIAQAGVDAIQAKIETGQASARDQEQARLDAEDKYAAYLDTSFELYKAQLQMMRATGSLQQWALEAK